ncbi:hypothetical protein [Desulfobacter curvatus]|uniref:hypothetical protein n=1 Tax=Desulfobacter curvatus TaxID=2290 RepID=UPI000374C0FC|nr:hypothetical protein [Desulfobacter curvatus]
MADEPKVTLTYTQGCGDCGQRRAELPPPLPEIGDDFDWDVRDYDGYRLFMLEELAARFPERRSWTPADMEVVLVETLAVVLDQLSDMNDRVQAESFLETARRPDTVRRLLKMIGYDPILYTDEKLLDRVSQLTDGDNNRLERLWRYYPHLMEQAKKEGPRSIHQQHRMVTLQDYRNQLSGHPLVLDVDAFSRWTGSWDTHYVVVRLIENLLLDEELTEEKIAPDGHDVQEAFNLFNEQLASYYRQQNISDVPDVRGRTSRSLLQDIIQQQRMIGQEVLLEDAVLAGIVLKLSIRIQGDFYRSEISDMIREVLIDPVDGFFAPGNLSFGEDVVASDIIEVLTVQEGIESVCINRMKRIGAIYADQSGSGRIVLEGHEVAVLEDDAQMPERGLLNIILHGGKPG